MTTRLLVLGAVLLAACAPSGDVPDAKFWAVEDFVAARARNPDFGGFFPKDLVVPEGEPLRFVPGMQAAGQGLTLFPAVAGQGRPAAFVITDIWANWPDPWVQPVYLPRDEAGRPVEGALTVFPVDVASTFYSPFWRMEELLTPNLTDTTYRSARDALNAPAGTVQRSGSIVFCPIVTADTGFADDGSGTVMPITRAPAVLQPVPPQVHRGWLPRSSNQAWVDAQPVTYFDFGGDHAPSDGQRVFEAPLHFFVKAAGGAPLPLAAVLPEDPVRHAFVRRHDVVLPAGAAVFVPPSRADLRPLLEEKGVTAPVLTDVAYDAFVDRALQVAANGTCLDDPTTVPTCDWLDSPARLAALPSNTVTRTEVLLGIGVVMP
jgi:hypothetical protein